MSAPTEVVLVHRPPQGVADHISSFLIPAAIALFTAIELMFLLPLAHRILGTPDLHPGYWDCALLAYLARGVFNGVTKGWKPNAKAAA